MMNIAIVHDFLHTEGGAERVLKELVWMYPTADIYTITQDKKLATTWHPAKTVQQATTLVPNAFQKRPQLLLPILPLLAESLDLSGYDLVISSSSFVAKGVITGPATTHICYCHSPTRYLWDERARALRERSTLVRLVLRPIMHYLRIWDHQAAQRPDIMIANSKTVQERIARYYNRESVIVYPPVKTATGEKQKGAARNDDAAPYLVVGRLSKYKNIEHVIEACSTLQKPLHIVGTGSERERLMQKAGPTVKFFGFITEQELQDEYKKAKALIFPCSDDFGMVPVEAMAHGIPVLALKKGGVTETVIDGATGLFFSEPTPGAIKKTINAFEQHRQQFDETVIIEHAQQFSQEKFRQKMQRMVHEAQNKSRQHTAKTLVGNSEILYSETLNK